jgi:predicted RNase H-like HicB family nuclease
MKRSRLQKYEIVIYWDNEDKIFVAEVPELAGCMAHGKTQVDAVKNVNEAIELWLETAREFGDKIPVPREHRLAA